MADELEDANQWTPEHIAALEELDAELEEHIRATIAKQRPELLEIYKQPSRWTPEHIAALEELDAELEAHIRECIRKNRPELLK